ncbi:MAG: 3-deoxy-manno-octulosonate cytidylyltransferase [Dysgonamonadaceae bacterium]|jgi:3-deoxy-manno-octulosonate cytidylyltransferase (CMP-KDO synthetase)|nr:3-deoxy-manno-octulosonate cytidylyltransferase [Dysgonamonadaceae bacterium]
MKFVGIIPARYASTRFPGKPLADMLGKTMIQRVYERVSGLLDEVYVATDDQRIFDAATGFSGKVVMTSDTHRSGTDRCREAYEHIGRPFDVIINVQGDEPFIHENQIRLLQSCFEDPQTQIATLVKPFSPDTEPEVLFNPNTPKVILNKNRQVIYFSRSVIPYVRGKDIADWGSYTVFYKHIGIYAYRSEILKEIAALEPSALEKAESLEQLRWIENGYVIKAGITTEETLGIDTPEDLEKALKELRTTNH